MSGNPRKVVTTRDASFVDRLFKAGSEVTVCGRSELVAHVSGYISHVHKDLVLKNCILVVFKDDPENKKRLIEKTEVKYG